VKNWPRFAGALLPWIELWQLRHDRAMNRVLGPPEKLGPGPTVYGRCQP
jgi:hypothetical protein